MLELRVCELRVGELKVEIGELYFPMKNPRPKYLSLVIKYASGNYHPTIRPKS